MSKNTMLYGLLIAGGLLAYFAWKKNNTSSAGSQSQSTSTSGTFVDDVPVSQGVADELLQGTGGVKAPVKSIKDTLSQIVEPLIGTKQQMELSGQGQFLES
jgi:hypothetical protein